MTTQSYICHLTLYIWHYIHCISVIKPKVSIVLHPLSVWHYTLYVWHNFQYAWHHMNNLWHHTCKVWHQSTIFMIYQIYMISPIMCHENKTNISGISPTVFDITATSSVWSHLLYRWLHNNYGDLHTWNNYDIIHTLHHIKFRLYDINCQYLGHQKHCIHDIGSPIYVITSTVYDISYPIPVMAQRLTR